MKTVFKLTGLLLTAVATVYFIVFAIRHVESLPELEWNWKMFAALGISTLIYSSIMLIGGYGWYLLLRSVKEPVGLAVTLVIFSLAQFAKYIPGNVGHHIGRVALAKAYGLNIARVILTMSIEAGWLIVSSAVVALISIFVAGQSLLTFIPQAVSVWQIIGVAAAAVIIPLFGIMVIRRWLGGSSQKFLGIDAVVVPGALTLILCSFLYILTFVIVGAIMDILALAVFNAGESHFLFLIGLFSVAWISGFIVPGAPAGLGIREAILVTGLTPVYGSGVAVSLSVALRVVTTLGDGLAFAVALIAKNTLHR